MYLCNFSLFSTEPHETESKFICHTEKSAKHPYMGIGARNANIKKKKKIQEKKEDLPISPISIMEDKTS